MLKSNIRLGVAIEVCVSIWLSKSTEDIMENGIQRMLRVSGYGGSSTEIVFWTWYGSCTHELTTARVSHIPPAQITSARSINNPIVSVCYKQREVTEIGGVAGRCLVIME